MSARAAERDRNEERTPARVPRGTIHKEEEDGEGKSVCLSGIMTTTAVLDPFLTDLFMRERGTHSNIYYRTDGLVGGKIAHALTHPIPCSTLVLLLLPTPVPIRSVAAAIALTIHDERGHFQ